MKKLIIMSLLLNSICYAGFITHTDYVPGAVISSGGQNTNENAMFNEFNGNIDNTNIKSGSVTGTNIAANTIATSNLTTAAQAFLIPTGAIIAFGSETPPAGFLECDGSAVSRTTYAALYAVIGNNFGSGDGSTSFNLPATRGQFLRGWDHASGSDPNAATRIAFNSGGNSGDHVGSFQQSTTSVSGINIIDPGHNHTVLGVPTVGGGAAVALGDANSKSVAGFANGTNQYYNVAPTGGNQFIANATTGITLHGGSETRPLNTGVMYIIKT